MQYTMQSPRGAGQQGILPFDDGFQTDYICHAQMYEEWQDLNLPCLPCMQRKIQTLDSSTAGPPPEIDPDLPEELRAAMAAERGHSAGQHRPTDTFMHGGCIHFQSTGSWSACLLAWRID